MITLVRSFATATRYAVCNGEISANGACFRRDLLNKRTENYCKQNFPHSLLNMNIVVANNLSPARDLTAQ
jgi:hypothetical protein